MYLKKKYSLLTILVSLIVMLTQAVYGQGYEIDRRLFLQEGLSQSRIQCILEDERGFIWFGTADGLNRYDGYGNRIFRNRIGDSTSLPNNIINTMVETPDGIIWLGTDNGLVRFDPYLEHFESFRDTSLAPSQQGGNNIQSVVLSMDNVLWFSTYGNGLGWFDLKTNKRGYLFYEEQNKYGLNYIYSVFNDSQNRLWIGTYFNDGVYCYNLNSEKLSSFPAEGLSELNEKPFRCISFYEDPDQRIWTGIRDYKRNEGGVFYLDKGSGTFTNYESHLDPEFKNNFWYHLNTTAGITGDKSGNIWFASTHGGVFKFKYGESPTAYFAYSPDKDATISCLYKSTDGILWIGTNGYGVEISVPFPADFNTINRSSTPGFNIESIRAFAEGNEYYWVGGYAGLARISKDFKNIETVFSSAIYTLEDMAHDEQKLWFGSEGGGLGIFNKNNFMARGMSPKLSWSETMMANYLYIVFPYDDNDLLLGAEGGLFLYHIRKNEMDPISIDAEAYKGQKNTVRSISKDNSGQVIIGYENGVIGTYNHDSKTVDPYTVIPFENDYFVNNAINSIYQDSSNRYWIGSSHGLICFDPQTSKFRVFTQEDGLPNDHIYGILPDNRGNIWMSTNNGLSSFSLNDEVFRNFDVTDGLQNNEFNSGAYYRSKNGTLFFGGINGFNYFNPDLIQQNSIKPELQITGIRIDNRPVTLSKTEVEQHQLVIGAHNEVFTIEFAGLSFINSNKNHYKYRIREVSKDWIDLENLHQLTFNNIEPGTYHLEILASNNHGHWITEPYKLEISVLPTFVESVYFKWLILFLAILLVLLIIRLRFLQLTLQRNKIQKFADKQSANLMVTNNQLKQAIDDLKETTGQLEASNKTKDRFLSIIGHDLIGPLGVIQGFSDLLLDEPEDFSPEEKTTFTKTINQTTKELTLLLTNLLQWSRVQGQSISYHPEKLNLLTLVENTGSLLNGNMKEKGIRFEINIPEGLHIYADRNMVQTILRNLMSNAIKFCHPDTGVIEVEANRDYLNAKITISDNGVGMTAQTLEKIFKNNERITTRGTSNEKGTGLGLDLVREFIKRNHGELEVTSEPGQGTRFIFTLPTIPVNAEHQ